MTVLFADVVHSMDIAAAVGAERLREIMAELVNRVDSRGAALRRHGRTSSPATASWRCSARQSRSRITLFAPAWRRLDIQEDAQAARGRRPRPRRCRRCSCGSGLNSGQVIAGEIGSGPLAYTAIGEQVGMAQRMESVAPPGGVMVSESTARLVETRRHTGRSRSWCTSRAVDAPVVGASPARRSPPAACESARGGASFVGREWEMSALDGLLDRSINGNGCVVGVVGPPGIGKSRLVREIALRLPNAGCRGVHHLLRVPYHRRSHSMLLPRLRARRRTGRAVSTTRRHGRGAANGSRTPTSEDLLLLDDLLGIGDPAAALPQIDPDARRRRLAAMVNAAVVGRRTTGGVRHRGCALDR